VLRLTEGSAAAAGAEAGTLKLLVRNSAGRTVRAVQGSRSAGRTTLTWNGRDAANDRVAAGTYYSTYTSTDSAGNHRTTARYSVHVSDKWLVGKTATITKNGDSHYAIKTNATSCVQYSDRLSDFTHGVWLDITETIKQWRCLGLLPNTDRVGSNWLLYLRADPKRVLTAPEYKRGNVDRTALLEAIGTAAV
jgi:hypothetical protein